MRKGHFSPKDVFDLPPVSKIKVELNKFGQLIRRGNLILGKYIGESVKKENMIGLKYKCWDDIEETKRHHFLRYIRAKFILPKGKQVDRILLMNASIKWRNHKYYLKRTRTKDCALSKTEAYKKKPKNVSLNVWKQVVDYWYSEEFKNKSEEAKLSRAAKMHVHITGGKIFARVRDEFVQVHNREPGEIEFFELCHRRQDGSYFDKNSSDYIEAARSYVKEKTGADSLSEATIEVEAEAHYHLRGPDDRGRVKGYGYGIKPSQFNREKSTTDGASSSAARADREEVSMLRNQVASMEQMIATLQAQVGALASQRAAG